MHTATWLDSSPIPRKFQGYSPADEFERGLRDFRKGRRAELEDEILPDWRYYASVFRSQQEETEDNCRTGLSVRFDIREFAHDESDFLIDAMNYPAHHALEVTAYGLGWRVVALACWASAKTGDPSIARDVEIACRAHVGHMDAVWHGIVRMPDTRRNRESHRAQVEPLLLRAREIGRLLEDRLARLGLFDRPWV